MHFALFIVNKNGTLVYDKVWLFEPKTINLGNASSYEVLEQRYNPFSINFSFNARYLLPNYSCKILNTKYFPIELLRN